ncbi:Synaptophysin [Araneus ventricosus]|uniref:Synaptophysin n=1 Tax=Araneus ventricosus TaxID=182803 RepID=A0A4Y2PDC8_ARAVE|nr:Synaptophysin [Araneus ventricosus]GBN49008.1 Synaptophysin [Araneus ventricosus]GBN50807.1 Synaptophysin [Araneus ventricosus]GBN50859.1 Synaptophysin [Araneus ventricosus]
MATRRYRSANEGTATFINMDLNLRVMIEPRGFIRIIQLVMSIFAFATTADFETVATMEIKCKEYEKDVQYKFGYPFKLGKNELRVPEKCGNTSVITFKTYTFPFDFSSNAEFFVASGVLTLMYTSGIIFIYVFMHRLYTTNPMTPVVDLLATVILSIFWFAGSCAWAQGVSDVKYYTNPSNLFHDIDICMDDAQTCSTKSPGNFASLNVSLIFGFGNCMLWISSLWFVYKETSFHQQVQPPAMLPQMGQQQAPPMQDQDLGNKMGGQYEY